VAKKKKPLLHPLPLLPQLLLLLRHLLLLRLLPLHPLLLMLLPPLLLAPLLQLPLLLRLLQKPRSNTSFRVSEEQPPSGGFFSSVNRLYLPLRVGCERRAAL
jgi:hypothetical protein